MKFLTTLVLALSFSAFAGHHKHDKKWEEWKKLPFDQQKTMMQEKLERKSAIVQEGQVCVNNAKNSNDLMGCKERMQEDKHAMRDEMKDKMMDMKKKK